MHYRKKVIRNSKNGIIQESGMNISGNRGVVPRVNGFLNSIGNEVGVINKHSLRRYRHTKVSKGKIPLRDYQDSGDRLDYNTVELGGEEKLRFSKISLLPNEFIHKH